LSSIQVSTVSSSQADRLFHIIYSACFPVTIPEKFSNLLSWLSQTRPQCSGIQFRDGTADECVEIIKSVPSNPEDWSKDNVSSLVNFFRGLLSIEIQRSSPNAKQIYYEFMPKWSTYLENHPLVKAQVDPFIVVVDSGGPQAPINWPILYPPVAAQQGPLTTAIQGVNVNTRDYVKAFANQEEAHAWAGFLLGNGLRSWIIRTTDPVAYY